MRDVISIEQAPVTVTISVDDGETITVISQQEATDTITVDVGGIGERGPAGPPGVSDISANVSLYTAAVSISGHTPVIATASGVIPASSSNVSHSSVVIGVSNGACIAGALCSVVTSGDIVEPSWSWIAGGAVYLSSNGTLTQTAPTTGFILQVGVAVLPTKIIVGIRLPIIL